MENVPMKICTSALKTESLNGKNLEINYKSGGHYKGDVVDNKRYGKGSMYWPDGSVYHGDFVNDQRSGQGHQVYRDKSCYKGQFISDKRNGYGIQKFKNGEMYEGHFFQDLRHGVGKFIWPKECEFVGLFYANNKEGYGTMKFANGNIFQGLYKDDKREGPGILTYKETQLQDVGLWSGLRLIRIASKLPGLFSVSQYRHFRCTKHEMPIITAADSWCSPSLLKDLCNIPDYNSDVFEKIKDIYLEYPDCCNVKVNHELFNKVFIQQTSRMVDLQCTCRLWNITPYLENLQKHILKHSFEQTLINVDDILNYNRYCFNPEGPLEHFSGQLLWASACGRNVIVERLLNEDILHPDVAGIDGNTALINATAIGNFTMINSLLNYGANINQLNDEGCSSLAVGFVLLHPVESLNMKLLCDAPGQLPLDMDDNSPVPTAISLIAGGDNCKRTSNPPNQTSVLAERTNSMELESLEDYQTASPRNLISADEVDSGISRGSQFRQRKASRRISPGSLDKKDFPKKKSTGIFSNASIPHQNPLLKSREKTSTQGQLSSLDSPKFCFYRDKTITESKQVELRTSTDLPNIQNEVTAKEGVFTSSSYACQAGLDSLNRSSSWRKNYRVSDWMNSTNFEKAENDSKTILSSKSPIRNDMEELTKRFVQKMTRNLFPAPRGQDKEKAFVDRNKNPYRECVEFLLKRGADPNSSDCPWPVLFIAVRALDVPIVKTLLLKGANANASLPKEDGGMYPLHVACSRPSREGYEIVELLLNSLADPDARIALDNSYLDAAQLSDNPDDALDRANWASSGGRTALHIACGQENNMEEAANITRLLLENRANPDLLCNGVSALAIAITHGNIAAVNALLDNGADPSLLLGLGLCNPLCTAVLAHFKGNLSTFTCLQLLSKLVNAGADMLAKIPIGPKQIPGSVVDFCHQLFQQDYRISHLPTHALTLAEREIYKNRKDIGSHAGYLLREAALGKFYKSDDPKGTGKMKIGSEGSRNVTFDFQSVSEDRSDLNHMNMRTSWCLLDFCYECGRSVNVKLIPCTRCKVVSYCSKICKSRAWTKRHKDECIKVEEKKKQAKGRRANSPPFSRRERKSDPLLPALKEPRKLNLKLVTRLQVATRKKNREEEQQQQQQQQQE